MGDAGRLSSLGFEGDKEAVLEFWLVRSPGRIVYVPPSESVAPCTPLRSILAQPDSAPSLTTRASSLPSTTPVGADCCSMMSSSRPLCAPKRGWGTSAISRTAAACPMLDACTCDTEDSGAAQKGRVMLTSNEGPASGWRTESDAFGGQQISLTTLGSQSFGSRFG